MSSQAWSVNTNDIMVAVPLFVLMGEWMNRSGIGERMYAVISRWIWFLSGGLIHTNVVSCAIFAARSGSRVATWATISRASLPSFRRKNENQEDRNLTQRPDHSSLSVRPRNTWVKMSVSRMD